MFVACLRPRKYFYVMGVSISYKLHSHHGGFPANPLILNFKGGNWLRVWQLQKNYFFIALQRTRNIFFKISVTSLIANELKHNLPRLILIECEYVFSKSFPACSNSKAVHKTGFIHLENYRPEIFLWIRNFWLEPKCGFFGSETPPCFYIIETCFYILTVCLSSFGLFLIWVLQFLVYFSFFQYLWFVPG